MPQVGARPDRRAPDRRGYRGKYVPRRKVCPFCAKKIEIDYKNVLLLRQYISNRGKIEPCRKTGACAKHQRVLATAIKRARFLALLPYVPDHIYETRGTAVSE